jgi:hypothetical protein
MSEELTKRAQEVGFLQAAAEAGALVTGRPVRDGFTEGWSKAAFSRGDKAHYFYRDADLRDGAYGYTAACGVTTVSTRRVPLFEAGNYPMCSRCDSKLLKRTVSSNPAIKGNRGGVCPE